MNRIFKHYKLSGRAILFLQALAVGLFGSALAAVPFAAHAQVVLSSSAPKTENFDGMGTSATATAPAGIKLSGEAAPTFASANNYTLTSVASNGGTSSTHNISTGGTYNFVSVVGSTDRALGFLNSGSFGTPRSIMLAVNNSSGATIQDLTVQFKLEKYRSGAREYNWTFHTSSDGQTWTTQSAGAQNYPADASNTVYHAPPQTIEKTVSLPGVNLPTGTTYYLRWTQIGVGGTLSSSTNGQASGIDDVTLTPTLVGSPAPTPTATITTSPVSPTSFCLNASAGSTRLDVAYTTSGTFSGTYKVQLSDAAGAFPTNATAGVIGTGNTSPISATIPATTASGTKYRVRVLNDGPVTYGSDNGADLTIGQAPDSNPVTVSPATAQSVATTGTGATLTASAAASSTFIWQYSSTSTGPFTPIAGATTAAYQLKGADFPGAGTYYVVAKASLTNSCGSVTSVSEPISVNVSPPVVTQSMSVSATSLPDFTNVTVGAGSQTKNFTVSGNSLTGNIIITPPAGFEIRTGTSPFACCAIELAPVGGDVPSTTIEVRFAPTVAQSAQASIPVTSEGLPNQTVAVSGTGVEAVYPATLSTAQITDLTTTTATTGGDVTLNGGSAVTARGVVWAKTANPILSAAPGATKTADGAGTGTFTSALTGLVPGTTYFVRAYATNGVITAYGDELSFTTVAVPLAAEPTTPAALTASQVTGSSMVLNLTGGDGTKRLVIARLGSPVDAVPTDATTYTANSEFGKGSNLGQGNYVVYNGTANADTITNLRPNTTYHFSVFAFSDNNTAYAENYLTTSPGTLQQATPALPATLLLEENFDYTANTVLTANGWTAHSTGTNTTTSSRPITVTSGGLSYAGYGPNSGNAAAVVASGEDVNRTFEAMYARTPVYASLLVKVNSVNTTGEYFFHLGPKNIGSTFRGRVWVRRVGTTNKVVFGIASGSGTIIYTTEEYDLGVTHLLVLKYTFDEEDNASELFVNPVSDTEPGKPSVRAAELGTTPSPPNDNIGAVALRQGGSATPNVLVDGIRVGTTYRVVKTGLTCLPPVASFTAAPVCAGTFTAFVDASTTVEANATYAWDTNNDGTTDFTTKGNSSYTYAEAGVYTAKLTITQGACSDSYTQQVTVRALPTALLSGDATVCPGKTATLTLHLTGTAPWTVSYSADGGATSTPLTVTAAEVNADGNYFLPVTPTATTTYSLTALTDATTCAGTGLSSTATVTVTTPPVLTAPSIPTATTSANACGASVAFAATATGSPVPTITYSIVQDGVATAITSPYFFPVGTTTVTATATNSCGSNTKTFVVTVEDKQAPTVLTQTVTVELKGGIATTTTAQVDNGSSDACGIATLTLSKTTFDCSNIGLNTVTLTVTDIHGNVASRMATVNVKGVIPTPTIAVAQTSTVYTGGIAENLYLGYGPQGVTLTASGGVSYQWSPAAGLSNASSAAPVFTATVPGTFTFEVTATSASGCTATQRVTLRVVDVMCGNKNDKVTICHKGKPQCVSPNDVPSYLKQGDTLGDCGPLPSKSNASANSTASSTAQRTAVQSSASTGARVFEAYPNPFTERTTIHFRAISTGPAQLEIYNAVGQVVKTFYNGVAQEGQDYEFTLNGATLPAGMYTGRLLMDGKVEVLRLGLTK